jgi:scyllo-inositol 2-dehydrogenase (NADP+)
VPNPPKPQPAGRATPGVADPLHVGLLGYGVAGQVFHAPLIAATAGLRLAAIVTGNPQRAAQAEAEHPSAIVLPSADALFDRAGDLDLVVVASPNMTHVALARRALAAGVAVVVDKPMAPTPEEARALVAAAAAGGVLLTAFHNRRWDNDFRTLRRLLGEGRLGRVHRFESRYERWRPALREHSWREEADPATAGGVLYDLGTHVIDQALVAFGPVTTVYAELDRRRVGSSVDDDDFVALTHASGVRSHLWMSAVAPRLGPRLRVLGDRAGYVKYGLDVQEPQLRAGLRPGDPGWGVETPEHDGTLGAGDAVETIPTLPGAYEAFYAALVPALREGDPPPVDPADAVATLEVIAAAQRSAREKSAVRLR